MKKKPKAKSVSPGSAGPMNVDFLQQLVNLMTANDLNTVDLREAGKRIILKRGAVVAAGAAMIQVPAAAQHASQASAPPPPAKTDKDDGLIAIKSPMVGTFYSKPSPDAKPFVIVGSHVIKDETDVCVLEAMKSFSTLKADVTGEIVRILVDNGESVDVNKPLFLVKPN